MFGRPKFIFENCKQTEKIEIYLGAQHFPTWGQECISSELQSFEKANYDLGHPVFNFQSHLAVVKHLQKIVRILKYLVLQQVHVMQRYARIMKMSVR